MTDKKTCPVCNGTGQTRHAVEGGAVAFAHCPNCLGRGFVRRVDQPPPRSDCADDPNCHDMREILATQARDKFAAEVLRVLVIGYEGDFSIYPPRALGDAADNIARVTWSIVDAVMARRGGA